MASSGSNAVADRIRKQTAMYQAESLAKKIKEAQDELANVRLAMGQEQTELYADLRTLVDFIAEAVSGVHLPFTVADVVGRVTERRIAEAAARIEQIQKTVEVASNGEHISLGYDPQSTSQLMKL